MRLSSFNMLQNAKGFPYCWCCCSVLLIIGFGVWGSVTAAFYVRDRNTRNDYSGTTCLLLDYKMYTTSCRSCNSETGSSHMYTCYNEVFWLSYSTFDGRSVSGTYYTWEQSSQHPQRIIGQTYSCYYNVKQVTAVTLKLVDPKPQLIQFIIAFSLVVLILFILIIITCCYFFGRRNQSLDAN